jgi:hypothetical protein
MGSKSQFCERPDLLVPLVGLLEPASSSYSEWLGYGRSGGCVKARQRKEPVYGREITQQIAGAAPIEPRRSDEFGARDIHAGIFLVPHKFQAATPRGTFVT